MCSDRSSGEGVIVGKDRDTPLLTYTYVFFGMWAAWWVLDALVRLVVAALQFIFFGTTARSELILESRLDQPQVQELLNSDEFTRQSLGEQFAAELKENNKSLRPFMYFIMGIVYIIGLIVVFFLGR